MALREQGQGAANVWTARGGWAVEDALAGDRTRQAARVWPLAIGAAVAVIDFEAALIDGCCRWLGGAGWSIRHRRISPV